MADDIDDGAPVRCSNCGNTGVLNIEDDHLFVEWDVTDYKERGHERPH
jgi:hypothetical protein